MNLLPYIQHLDHLTFDWCLRRKHRQAAIKISRCVSFTADGPLYVLIGLGLLLTQEWPLAKLIAIGFLIERVIYLIAKTSFKRNRPPEAIPGFESAIVPSDKFSFPSGHTSAAFFMACALSSAFPLLAWFLFPWAVAVACARVVLGVHFPTDTVVGGLLGLSICQILLNFF